jgi:hypothetical protein
MKAKILLLAAFLFVCAAAISCRVNATATNYTIVLRHPANVTLTQPETEMLYSNLINMVKSSNFNSSQPKTQIWPEYQAAGVQNDYKWAVSSNYLAVTLKDEQAIQTVGGTVNVKEIVLGLHLDDGHGRNELFTKDEKGQIISHGKYSGPLWVELCQEAEKIAD